MIRHSAIIILMLLGTSATWAEPYLAVRSGEPCGACHINPAGGGMRSEFGSAYAQTQLAARPDNTATKLLNALVNKAISVGANARYSGQSSEVDDREDNPRFDVDRVSLYLSAKVNERVTLYLDQQVAPGGSLNREAWAMYRAGDWYLKAGRLFLPFGWRLEDDTAFIRQATGINFNNPDNGVELGYRAGRLDIQLAFTNGRAGAAEVDDGKQFSLRAEYLDNHWRVGVSGNRNNTDAGDRTMYGLFAGLQTGKISWLAEWDRIEDKGFGLPDQELDVALLEANYEVLKGHNIKITLEGITSDQADAEDRYRGSLIWEYFPLPFTQLRAGFRQFDSDNDIALDNREEGFVQLHVFF